MRHHSDLVRDSKLPTQFRGDITRHVIETSGRDRRHRKIKRDQRWQRLETLGQGTFGIVWKEKLVSGDSDVNERAVKMIRKSLGKKTVDYRRELEAIAKFSRSNVSVEIPESCWLLTTTAVQPVFCTELRMVRVSRRSFHHYGVL